MPFTVTQFFASKGVTADEGEIWWELKERLLAGGASVKLSSDGTTFGAADNLDPGGPYTGTFDNTDAWVVLAWPSFGGVVREVLIQNTASTGRIRYWYSSDGVGFSGGGATTRPTATDEEFLQNSGDNVLLTTNPQDVVVNYIVGDAVEGYSWAMEVHALGGAQGPQASLFMDVLSVFNPGDADPAVLACLTADTQPHYRSDSDAFTATLVGNATSNIAGWFRKGTGSAVWVAYPFGHPGYFVGSAGAIQMWHEQQDPDANGDLPLLPLMYVRGEDVFAQSLGFKGVSRLFQMTPYRGFSVDAVRQEVNADESLAGWHGVVRPWAADLDRRW